MNVDPPDLPEAGAAEAEQTAPSRRGRGACLRRIASRLARVTVWQWGLVVLVSLYTGYFTWLSLQIHYGLGTATYDFALYDQGVWLLSRFKAPFVTLMGRSLFGDHSSFVLLFLVPVYWVLPGAGTLLFAQSVAIGATAIPVFLYTRRRLGSEALALLLAACVLLHPTLSWGNLEEFHPDAFLGAFLAFAIYAALTKRWRSYMLFVLLVMLVKEDVWLVLVPLGAWVAAKRDLRAGVLTIAASTVFTFVLALPLMGTLTGVPLRNAWRIPFGGPRGFLSEVVARPGNLFEYLRSEGRPWYLWQMTAPYAWAFLRLPDVAAISAVVIGFNLLSTFGYQHQIQFHYSIVAVPALALGTVHALGALGRRFRRWALGAVVIMAVWTAFLWGPLTFARNPLVYWSPSDEVPVAARQVMADIPDDAVVSAHFAITPHLARREQVYMFPNPFKVVMYGPDLSLELEGARLPEADDVEYVVLPVARQPDIEEPWAKVRDDFTLVRANQWWELYRRADAGTGTATP